MTCSSGISQSVWHCDCTLTNRPETGAALWCPVWTMQTGIVLLQNRYRVTPKRKSTLIVYRIRKTVKCCKWNIQNSSHVVVSGVFYFWISPPAVSRQPTLDHTAMNGADWTTQQGTGQTGPHSKEWGRLDHTAMNGAGWTTQQGTEQAGPHSNERGG